MGTEGSADAEEAQQRTDAPGGEECEGRSTSRWERVASAG